MQAVAEWRGQRARQPIVAAFDAIHPARRRRVAGGELIDQRDERQLVGIGEKEPAQPGRRRPQLGVGAHLVEPRRDRSPREIGGDRRVPAVLGERVRFGQRPELFRHPLPAARGAARGDLRLPGAVGPHVAEAAAEDPRELQPELLGELADLRLVLVDQVAAGLGVLAVGEAVAQRPDAAADAVARVDDGDRAPSATRSRAAASPASPAPATSTETPLSVSHAHTLNGNARRLR